MTADLDDAVATSPMVTPHILKVGEDGTDQCFIVAERETVVEVTSFLRAVLLLIGCYYVFDIEYANNTCLFIERYLLKITNGPNLTKSCLATISDIDSVHM